MSACHQIVGVLEIGHLEGVRPQQERARIRQRAQHALVQHACRRHPRHEHAWPEGDAQVLVAGLVAQRHRVRDQTGMQHLQPAAPLHEHEVPAAVGKGLVLRVVAIGDVRDPLHQRVVAAADGARGPHGQLPFVMLRSMADPRRKANSHAGRGRLRPTASPGGSSSPLSTWSDKRVEAPRKQREVGTPEDAKMPKDARILLFSWRL
ncbi:hypothetical protein [Sorangium sp. So ce426]|uniref:hypothetical protein n=1 Tax=Sorangium sp. So ce426 TaxID=3133312 RepID=UPI003F5BD8E5